MKELLDELDAWRRARRRIALARVVDIEGSGPRLPGAAMAVADGGEVIGSVSGGCVEGAVVAEALGSLTSGERRVVTFGYSDDDAFAVGLTCGGIVHLFIEELGGSPWRTPDGLDLYDALAVELRAQRPVALASVVEGPHTGAVLLLRPGRDAVGTLGHPALDRVVGRDALGELDTGRSEVRHYGAAGEARERVVTVFVESFAPPPRMLVFGAVDFTGALVRAAKLLGYHVTVCDARSVFATRRRFPEADEVVVDWPHRLVERIQADAEVPDLSGRDTICILTHDAKFDVPAVVAAVATDAGYIGVMGSRRTHADRSARLREAGLSDAQLARLHSPIGLDLGARTPREVAIAVLAETISVRTGRDGRPLRETDGPLH
jgi:xanthine dehydrogenase accessory factor